MYSHDLSEVGDIFFMRNLFLKTSVCTLASVTKGKEKKQISHHECVFLNRFLECKDKYLQS